MLVTQQQLRIDLHNRHLFFGPAEQRKPGIGRKVSGQRKVSQWVKENVQYECIAVIEAMRTWIYPYDQLENILQQIFLVPAKKVKAIASTAVKTDRIEAEVLATLARLNYLPRTYEASPELMIEAFRTIPLEIPVS